MRQPDVSPAAVEAVIAARGRVQVIDQIDPARTALVVIDMQNFFLEPGQLLEIPAARDIVPNINRLAAATRAAGGTVAWVRMTLDDAELDVWSVFLPVNGTPERRAVFRSLASGKPAHRLWPELDVVADDLFVDKSRFSAFIQGSSDLRAQLGERGIDTLLIVGTLTNVCCESTARDAMMLNYRVMMIDDANATFSPQAHRASLDNIMTFFGDVCSTDQVLAMITRSNAGSPVTSPATS
jgi:ureidoacrylate peracid hydrolase